MTEPAAPAPKKRGPSTPEGKARSSMNAIRHGLRARSFGLLPEESKAEWALHVGDLRRSYRPRDAAEEKLVTALAAAMWLEIRADRTLVETMAEIPPVAPGRSHGTDLQDARHAAALGTALRYQTAAGMATQRAQRAFFAHRKAVKDGLVPEAADEAVPDVPAPVPEPANQNCTNDLSAPLEHAEPEPEPELGCAVAAGTGDTDEDEEDGLDDEAWLATLPVVESDPEREAERRRAILKIEPKAVRRLFGRAPLRQVEQHLVCGDPVAYEEWFARQPKPPRSPAKCLTAEDAAAVEWVTRHNPPWIRGEYLGYYRPPVPAHLFLPGATGDEPPPRAPHAAVPAALPAPPDLRARLARLLDRTQPRRPEELALAEAICAVKWPNWPNYQGAIDLDALRLALREFRIDATTLHWLDSHELARQCREGV
jgi:hypothetical protein